MEYSDDRLLNRLDKIDERLGKLEVSVGSIEGQMKGYKNGAPVQPSTTAAPAGMMDSFNNRNGPFYMAIVSIIITITSAINQAIGAK